MTEIEKNKGIGFNEDVGRHISVPGKQHQHRCEEVEPATVLPL